MCWTAGWRVLKSCCSAGAVAASERDIIMAASSSGNSHGKHPVPKFLRGWILPALLLLLWWLAVKFNWSTSPLLVPVDKVWDTAVEQFRSGKLASSAIASSRRDVIGFAIGFSAGRVFAIALALSPL